MASESSAVMSRLREAVQKVRFLLSLSDTTRWVITSIAGSSPMRPRLSFKRQLSLLDCTGDGAEDYYEVGSSLSTSRTSSTVVSRTSSSISMTRTSSDASTASCYDIDTRADLFIEQFREHLRMEKQVSLEIRYRKEKSLERTWSDSYV
ncbi:uncharacterized protein [Typha angustifolia]|uniref:uncharacterized protein n=1 Tax=Typha angustifolia TaxID=59011 RepID=UPI003C2F48D9